MYFAKKYKALKHILNLYLMSKSKSIKAVPSSKSVVYFWIFVRAYASSFAPPCINILADLTYELNILISTSINSGLIDLCTYNQIHQFIYYEIYTNTTARIFSKPTTTEIKSVSDAICITPILCRIMVQMEHV